MIPLYPKIRITLEQARRLLTPFMGLLARSQQTVHSWDLYLTSVNELRSEIAREDDLAPGIREDVLAQNWPRFMWRATALEGDREVADVLMDATDIHTTFFVREILFRDDDAREALQAMIDDSGAWERALEEVRQGWDESEIKLWRRHLEDEVG